MKATFCGYLIVGVVCALATLDSHTVAAQSSPWNLPTQAQVSAALEANVGAGEIKHDRLHMDCGAR